MSRLLRDPLFHFVVAGAVLFGAYALWRGPDQAAGDAATTIVVDRRELLTFLQYRANAFEPELFAAALDAMTDAELDELIAAYVEEEVLYREAEALGLDASDNIIRQRMVQKMRFLVADLADPGAGATIDDAALADYFEANIEAYAVAPWATFTHVFFDSARRGDDAARAAAEASLEMLNRTSAGFNDAPSHGDPFPYLRNYVERTIEYVAGHFGYDFAAAIAELEPSDRWQGPFRSAYGEHLVLLTERVDRSYPALADVLSDVERDYVTERADATTAELIDALRGRYRVEIAPIRSAGE
ncbi:MAG: peptidylprolyl isomerase [Gammaproteobacteria bacterium]|nr:peptidylprolyl isomerase [Gammaproteobacteria bacterium]